jgi:hypothetical protein
MEADMAADEAAPAEAAQEEGTPPAKAVQEEATPADTTATEAEAVQEEATPADTTATEAEAPAVTEAPAAGYESEDDDVVFFADHMEVMEGHHMCRDMDSEECVPPSFVCACGCFVCLVVGAASSLSCCVRYVARPPTLLLSRGFSLALRWVRYKFRLEKNILYRSLSDSENGDTINLRGSAIVYAQKNFAGKKTSILLATPRKNYFM